MVSRNKKQCVICGRVFDSPPSDKKVTCSPECRSEYARIRRTGLKHSSETRQKISDAAKGRDTSVFQKTGTAAALRSPKAGRFETNVNAIDWHLISPEGQHYYFRSLQHWLRENCRELFGCEPDSREFHNIRAVLCNAKAAASGRGKYPCTTYRGWRCLPIDDNNY